MPHLGQMILCIPPQAMIYSRPGMIPRRISGTQIQPCAASCGFTSPRNPQLGFGQITNDSGYSLGIANQKTNHPNMIISDGAKKLSSKEIKKMFIMMNKTAIPKNRNSHFLLFFGSTQKPLNTHIPPKREPMSVTTTNDQKG